MARLQFFLAVSLLLVIASMASASTSTSSQELSAVVTPALGWKDDAAYGSDLKTSTTTIRTPAGSFNAVIAYSTK